MHASLSTLPFLSHPLSASAGLVEGQEVAVPSPSYRTLLRKGNQPRGQPPLVGAGTGGREGFSAVPLLRLQM